MGFEIAIFVAQIALIGALFIYLGEQFARGISARFDVPYFETSYALLSKIDAALAISPGDIVYELGCGDGRVVFWCAKKHPDARFIGIERNPALYRYARLKWHVVGRPQNVEFRQEDIFETDFSNATRVYTFLLQNVMLKLFPPEKNFPGMLLVSRAFPLVERTPSATIELTTSKGWFGEHLAYVYDWRA